MILSKKYKSYWRRCPNSNVFSLTPPTVYSSHTTSSIEKPNASTSTSTSALTSVAQANYVPVLKLSAHVSSTPSIETDDTGSSSDESDGEEEDGNPKRRLMLMAKQF